MKIHHSLHSISTVLLATLTLHTPWAMAHPGHAESPIVGMEPRLDAFSSFLEGFLHPYSGGDHLLILAMVGAVWSIQNVQKWSAVRLVLGLAATFQVLQHLTSQMPHLVIPTSILYFVGMILSSVSLVCMWSMTQGALFNRLKVYAGDKPAHLISQGVAVLMVLIGFAT